MATPKHVVLVSAVLLLAGLARAEDILPEYKNVKEGQVFVFVVKAMNKPEMTSEYRVTKIDKEKGTLTYVTTTKGIMAGKETTNEMPAKTISMTVDPTKRPPPPPKPETVEVKTKCGEKDVTL